MQYGCGKWTINATRQKQFEATETWFLMNNMAVPWTTKRTNHQALQMGGSTWSLRTTIKQRELRDLGNVSRSKSLFKDCQSKAANEVYGRRESIGRICGRMAEVIRMAED